MVVGLFLCCNLIECILVVGVWLVEDFLCFFGEEFVVFVLCDECIVVLYCIECVFVVCVGLVWV